MMKKNKVIKIKEKESRIVVIIFLNNVHISINIKERLWWFVFRKWLSPFNKETFFLYKWESGKEMQKKY